MSDRALSWARVSTCCPAGRLRWVVTVVQFCQPLVAGMSTPPVRLLPDALATCRAPLTALGAATRMLRVYVPAEATLTVYRNHCPPAVQPTSYAPPASDVASRSTPSGR